MFRNSTVQKLILTILLSFTLALPVFAEIKEFTPQMPLPEINSGDGKITVSDINNGSALGKYVAGLYRFAYSIVGILATIIIMYGGLLHITAAGNSGKEKEAWEWITAAISGLLLLLSTYVILNFVNPDLVRFKSIGIQKIAPGIPATSTPISDNMACSSDDQCGLGYSCVAVGASKRCKSTHDIEGSTCTNGTCPSPLSCKGRAAGQNPGLCYDGTPGDPCCANSECLSGNCNNSFFNLCVIQEKKYTCQ